jgi:hypothetical protein
MQYFGEIRDVHADEEDVMPAASGQVSMYAGSRQAIWQP